MAYEHWNDAITEAAKHPFPADRTEEIKERVRRKRDELGDEGVRGHCIKFNPVAWSELLPQSLVGRTQVTRGDVFKIAGNASASDALAASFVWGFGNIGYGPARYRRLVESTAGQLDQMLGRVVAAAQDDVIAGYAMFYGGYDAKLRARPNDPQWARIDRLGPAFFTKFLYFTTPGALILDNVLARKVARLSTVPYLVGRRGQSYQWSPYRYAVYLSWMNQTATKLYCTPEELELTLFDSKV